MIATGVITALVLASAALVLALAPRRLTRRVRGRLADFVLWQWEVCSRLSARVHALIYPEAQRGDDDS